MSYSAGRDNPGASFEQSALEEEVLGSQSSSSPQEVIRRLLQICCQLEEERDAAEQALKSGDTSNKSDLLIAPCL